jgi:hypothetical protein
MRFIVKEQPYEKLIAAGQFRYERDGKPTGAIESWRLSTAVSGYQVVRVDLDAREAASEHSYLYHLVRQENGRPERLSYRFWGHELTIEGTLLFEPDAVTGTRSVNGRVFEEDFNLPAGYGFWFPSSVGAAMLGQMSEWQGETAVTLNGNVSGDEALALQQTQPTWQGGEPEQMMIAKKSLAVRPYILRWDGQKRTVWLDAQNWPVKMARDNGLTAMETRYIWYRQLVDSKQ